MSLKATDQLNEKNKYLQNFCRQYYATVRPGRMLQRPEPMQFRGWDNSPKDFYHYHVTTYEVPSVEINLAEPEFNKLLSDLDEISSNDYNSYTKLKEMFGDRFVAEITYHKSRESREASLRSRNPGVQKAWENYQLMLKLAGG